MSDANLNLVISLALMLIAVISVWKDVYNNNPPKKFFSRITRVGRILLIATCVFILINYLKDNNTERKVAIAEVAKNKADSTSDAAQKKLAQSQEKLKQLQESLYELQISVRETILTRVDSSYRKSIRASNEALAKYHIKIVDSLHTVVGKLKLNSVHPQLALAPVSNHPPVFLNKVGSDSLKLQFVAANNTCYNVRVYAYFFSLTNKGVKFIYEDSLYIGNTFINPDVTSTITCSVRKDVLLLSNTLIVLSGSFSKDLLDKESLPYFEAFEFDFTSNRYLDKPQISEIQFKALMSLK